MLVHATTVLVEGAGVLIRGPAGSGKSDLALRLIDAGASLVADDQTEVTRVSDAGGERLLASAPKAIAGRMEVRGLGVAEVRSASAAHIVLAVDLVGPAEVERMPEGGRRVELLGVSIPLLRLAPFEASALAKLRLVLVSLAHKTAIIPPL